MESWTTDDVCNYLGEPRKFSTTNLQTSPSPNPNVPKYLACTPDTSNLVSLCLDSATINIMQANSADGQRDITRPVEHANDRSDFGVAFYTGPGGGIRKRIGAPPSFAAPEIQLRDILTPACDVWSLGCLLYTLFSTNYMLTPDLGYCDTLLDLTFCFANFQIRGGVWGRTARNTMRKAAVKAREGWTSHVHRELFRISS